MSCAPSDRRQEERYGLQLNSISIISLTNTKITVSPKLPYALKVHGSNKHSRKEIRTINSTSTKPTKSN